MEAELQLHWGDGYLVILGTTIPECVLNKLRYWHRSLEIDPVSRMRVAKGEYRQLYEVTGQIDPETMQFRHKILTMPGFAHRIKAVLDHDGIPYRFIDERTPMPKPDMLKAMEGLREYQYECVYTALLSGGGQLACPTGWGKTHIMAAIIRAYSHEELCARNTPLVVVATPDKDITRKDFEDLKQMLPGRDVGLIMSGARKISDDVQVVTLDSLQHVPIDDAGIIIVDELHAAVSERRAEQLLLSRKAQRFGVSATPVGRFDGRDVVAEGIFGPIVYRRSYAQGIQDGALVPIKVYWYNSPEPAIGLRQYQMYKSRLGKYRHAVDQHELQNQVIADIIRRTPDKHQLMCIMQHINQMDQICMLDNTLKVVHSVERVEDLIADGYKHVPAVTSKERKARYQEMRDGQLRKILCTYVYKQGVNFPELRVILNAGGGGSELVAQQIPGRESRNIGGDKQESYLVDFYHTWDVVTDEDGKIKPGPVLRDDMAREKAYNELGFNQIWVSKIEELPFITQHA